MRVSGDIYISVIILIMWKIQIYYNYFPYTTNKIMNEDYFI